MTFPIQNNLCTPGMKSSVYGTAWINGWMDEGEDLTTSNKNNVKKYYNGICNVGMEYVQNGIP